MPHYIRWMLLLMVAGLNSCSSAPESEEDLVGRYVFEVYEENYSWGHTLKGFYIDHAGNVLVYDHSGDRWVPTPSRTGRVTDVDLAEKFESGKKILNLGSGTVLEKAKLIDSAARGAIQKYAQARDRGRFAYVGYMYDPDRRDYRTITLGADGDWLETNPTPAAQELLTWLKDVRDRVSDATR